jgi:chromosome segregation ATPase
MPNSLEQTGVAQGKKPSAKTRTIDEPPSEASTENKRPKEAATDGIVATMENDTNVPEDGATIVSIIKGLEGQVDTAFKLKEVVEADLEAAQKRLSKESAARAELQARVESLEPQAALVDRLREDIAFAEEEREKFANSLAETGQQLEAVTDERDSLAEEAACAKAHAEELEGEKTVLEAEVMNLTDRAADLNRVRRELAETTEARRDLGERVRDLSSRLEASDAARSALEGDLAEAREAVRSLREEVEDLRPRLAGAGSQVADLHLQLEEQQAANRDLTETKTRLESEIRTTKVDHVAAKNELEAVKRTLRDVSSELTGTSRRVRQRYFKEKDNEPAAAKATLRDAATELSSTTAPVRRQHFEVEDTQ